MYRFCLAMYCKGEVEYDQVVLWFSLVLWSDVTHRQSVSRSSKERVENSPVEQWYRNALSSKVRVETSPVA